MGTKSAVAVAAVAGIWSAFASGGHWPAGSAGGEQSVIGQSGGKESTAGQPVPDSDEIALDALLDSVVQELGSTGGSETESADHPLEAPPPALSVLEEDGEGCLWVRVELPGGARKTMASLPVRCEGVRAAADGKGGALLWSPGALLLVDAQGRVSELPLPKKGTIERAGFDGAGNPVGITWQEVRPRTDAQGPHVLYRGKRIDFGGVPHVGAMGLAHAFRWDGERWLEVETKASNGEACDTAGVEVLEAARSLDPAGRAGGLVAQTGSAARLAPLEEIAATGEAGEWRRLPVGEGHLYGWFLGDGLLAETGLVALESEERVTTLDTDLDGSQQAHLEIAGTYLLVSAHDGGEQARVFDGRSGRRVYEAAGRAAFWPTPATVQP